METRRMAAVSGSQLIAVENPNSRAQLQDIRHLVHEEVQDIPVPPPSINPGSIRSNRSRVSSRKSIQRKLQMEKSIAKINEEKRQIRLEGLEEKLRILQLEAAETNLENEDDPDLEITSNVHLRGAEVSAWAQQQAEFNEREQNYQQEQEVRLHEQVDALVNLPNTTSANGDGAHIGQVRKVHEAHQELKVITNSFASTMKEVIQSLRPNNDLQLFAARQTGAKDLPEFHGNPEEWPIFINSYERSTQLCKFTPEENIMRLQKCLKGDARKSVMSMLSSACNVSDVIQILKRQFGRPEQIIKTLLEKAKNAPTPVEGDFKTLMDFSSFIKNVCATADSLKLPMYLNNPQIVEEFRKKLPFHLQLEWGRHVIRTGKDADLRELSNFLEEVSAAAALVCDNSVNQAKYKKRDHCFTLTDVSCVMRCREAHALGACQKFKRLKVKQKYEVLKRNRLCFYCLERGHSKTSCSTPRRCDKEGCNKEHHPLLHFIPKSYSTNNSDLGKEEKTTEDQAVCAVSEIRQPVGEVLMKVIPVDLIGPKRNITVNAFLDPGSSVTMIDEDVAKVLGLNGECKSLYLNWLGGKTDCDTNSKVVSLKIKGINEKEEYELSNVRTKKNLQLPVVPLSNWKSFTKWTHLKDVPFPQVLPERPSIVIGEDNANLLLPRKAVEGVHGTPMASWTYLGWALHGPIPRSSARVRHISMINLEELDPDQALHELVKENFRIEALGVVNCKNLPQSKENERAEMLMNLNSRRVGDRWQTGMLWKTDDCCLPESKSAALRRLRVLEKQMDRDPKFAELYCAKIEEYVQKGFCRKLSPVEAAFDNERVWYLPHFGRFNPNKPGKLRLVFDCASKVNGISLNDALLQGPDLMSPLINVLLKFRQREVAFSGDIRDMFHMVQIRHEDLPALRFVWRGNDRSSPPNVYTMLVMIFGAISSPYQAQYIKNKNAEEFIEQYPDAVDAIKNRHYVDDYLDSCETAEEAIQKIRQVREIHSRGGFEISGWLCNVPEVLQSVAPEENKKDCLKVSEDKLERVLGLHWDPRADVFRYKVTYRNLDQKIITGDKIPTKRELLKLVMSLYDPLGFIAHLTVRGRILLQDVWKSAVGWDQQLDPALEPKWKSLLRQIKKIEDATVPRCLGPRISKSNNVQLHIFCDASQQAYSCVAYLRVTGRGEKVSVNILMAKSRVAPIKSISIPRLEMEAALIGARMLKFIRDNLDIKINSTHLWTDSKNVICWIRAPDPSKFKIYIAHRIGEILELSEADSWKWVPTTDNVADDATRDNQPADLSPSSRWFNGPLMLLQPESEWPKERNLVENAREEDLEIRKCCMSATEVDRLWMEKFSNWMKLIRVTAWILRFKENMKTIGARENKNLQKCLKVHELKSAINFCIKESQIRSFTEEIICLKKGGDIPRSSKIARLSPVMIDGIVCVKSRTVNSPHILNEAKLPPILDAKEFLTKLLISYYHEEYGHWGIEKICNELRQRYWIIGLKSAVKLAAKTCLKCQMDGAKQIIPEMAALPEVRVKKPPRAFTYVGVDYFGPFEGMNGRKREKRYGVLFTCMNTRAVHLEMAFSLSTDDFLLALNRFICRRGEPEEIWSDNGTNFRGAQTELKKALKEMDQKKLEENLSIREIKWHFIPPGAPHMGGAWERMVRSVKTAMHAILKNRKLNDQVLSTVLAEAEASVNSRPLTVVSSDINDPEAITPNCFLMGTTSIKQRLGEFSDGDLCHRKRWKHVQVLADHFWRRWIKEYLPSLALREKWTKKTPDIVLGEIVFVADMNQCRNNWTKGLVEAVYPGKDGHVRVVDVRTATGIIRRPVAKLYRIQPCCGDTGYPYHREGNVVVKK